MVNLRSQHHIQKNPNLVKSVTSYFTPCVNHVDGPIEEYRPDLTPIDIEVEFMGGEIIKTKLKSVRCKMCYRNGFYQIYSTGDIDGSENRCDKCGHQMWGLICYGWG